jgi:hypothetical protein
MRWTGHVACMGIGRFWWESWKKETTRKTRHRCGDNINMVFREIRWNGIDSINLAEDRYQ